MDDTVDDLQNIDETAEFTDAFENEAPESETEEGLESDNTDAALGTDDAQVILNQSDDDSAEGAPVSADIGSQDSPNTDFDPTKYQARLDSMSGRLSASDKRVNELAAENERLKQQLETGNTLQADEAEEPESPESDQLDVKGSALAELEEDFPEIVAAIKEVAPKPDPRLDEFADWKKQQQDRESEQAAQVHFQTIAEAHSDFQEVAQSAELESWINQQPSFLREGYQQVRAQGDANQIIEMLDQYKGGRQNQNNSGSRRVAVKSGGRSVIPRGRIDKDDFEGGWSDGE